MSLEQRGRAIERFCGDPTVRVFLMSLKAGGVALNLTAASHVMLMDPWWCVRFLLFMGFGFGFGRGFMNCLFFAWPELVARKLKLLGWLKTTHTALPS
jgi:hypothetical protein